MLGRYNITIVPLCFCVGNPVSPVQTPGGKKYPQLTPGPVKVLSIAGQLYVSPHGAPLSSAPQLFLDDKNFPRVFELMEGNGSSRRRRTRGFPIIIHRLKTYQRCPVGTRSGSQCCGKTHVINNQGVQY